MAMKPVKASCRAAELLAIQEKSKSIVNLLRWLLFTFQAYNHVACHSFNINYAVSVADSTEERKRNLEEKANAEKAALKAKLAEKDARSKATLAASGKAPAHLPLRYTCVDAYEDF